MFSVMIETKLLDVFLIVRALHSFCLTTWDTSCSSHLSFMIDFLKWVLQFWHLSCLLNLLVFWVFYYFSLNSCRIMLLIVVWFAWVSGRWETLWLFISWVGFRFKLVCDIFYNVSTLFLFLVFRIFRITVICCMSSISIWNICKKSKVVDLLRVVFFFKSSQLTA